MTAADELALTHAAISRRNARLADYVGAPLFRRAGRGLDMTQAGNPLRDACRRSFDDLHRTISSIRESEAAPENDILLSCERSVAMRWLIPRLSQFQDANPSIAVHLSVGGGALSGRTKHNMLAIRRLDFPIPQGWSAQTLWEERVGPVHAPPLTEDFAAGRYIALASRTRPDAWSRWLAEHPHIPRPKETRMLDHHFLMIEAACGGLGVGLSPRVVSIDDVTSARLNAPHGFHADGTVYGLLTPSTGSKSDSAVLLSDWLRKTSEGLSGDD